MTENNNIPRESYTFCCTKDEMSEYYKTKRKLQRRAQFRLILPFLIILIYALIPTLTDNSSSYVNMAVFILGFLFGLLLLFLSTNRATRKGHKKYVQQYDHRMRVFEIYDDYFTLTNSLNEEKTSYFKRNIDEIEQINVLDKWLEIITISEVFLLPKDIIQENSALYAFMYHNPSKTTKLYPKSRLEITSTVLFTCSFVSLPVALVLVAIISSINGLFYQNMWLFFLIEPIPIASTVLGFILKSKGYNYKKNLIVGIIMTVVLCIYGLFTFIF